MKNAETSDSLVRELSEGITLTLAKKAKAVTIHSAKSAVAQGAATKSALIYRLARTAGYPEEDVVRDTQRSGCWLKAGKVNRLPFEVDTSNLPTERFVEHWCFYLKGYEMLQGVASVNDDGVISHVHFFLHGDADA